MADIRIPWGWGPSRIKIGSTYYSFDQLKAEIYLREVWDKGFVNNKGRKIQNVIGYWFDFDFELTELMVDSSVSKTKEQAHLLNFINAYYMLSGDSKEIQFIPFADLVDSSWEESLNKTLFDVFVTQDPNLYSFKVNKKLGSYIKFKASTSEMIPAGTPIFIPYKKTGGTVWYNIGLNTGMSALHSSTPTTLQFKTGGTDVDADAKYVDFTT